LLFCREFGVRLWADAVKPQGIVQEQGSKVALEWIHDLGQVCLA
jgi:hypothetical protein